jgi:SOS response regulatory protein OraA/RecX
MKACTGGAVEADGPGSVGPEATTQPHYPPATVLKPALRLLSRRPRTVKEVRDHLSKKGISPPDISNCIRWLEERGLLNDESFARGLTRDRVQLSPRSPFLIRQELGRKGVASSLSARSVQQVLEEEGLEAQDLAVQAARAWVMRQSPDTRSHLLGARFTKEREKARRRLYGFLSRRGFRGDEARLGMEAGEEKARELED